MAGGTHVMTTRQDHSKVPAVKEHARGASNSSAKRKA